MPIEIKSGVTTDVLTVDVTSKAARITPYSSGGIEQGTVANPVQVNASTTPKWTGSTGTYSAASFRIPGVAATSQVLATIRNNAGAKNIVIRRLVVDASTTAAAIDLVAAYFRFWPNTGVTPSGGSAPTKHKLDSAYPTSQTETEILFAASADGTNATITHATPPSTPAREQARNNIMTAVGYSGNSSDFELIRYEHEPFVVRSGETCCLILVGSAVDVVTRHYTVKIIWEEATP